MRSSSLIFVAILAAAVPARGDAQGGNPTAIRFELGQRLRAFEAAWEQPASAAARKRTVAPLTTAVNAFFGAKFPEVGRNLDKARHALFSDMPAPDIVQWAESLYLMPETRCFDPAQKVLRLTLDTFYTTRETIPAGAKLSVELASDGKSLDGKKVFEVINVETAVTKIPLSITLDVAKLTEGDHTLHMSIRIEDMILALGSQMVSCVPQLAPRLAALKKQVEGWPANPATTDRSTTRSLLGVLNRLAQKETLETNYPAARLLRETEDLVKHSAAGQPFHGKHRPGSFWLTLAGQANTAVRVFVPESAKQGKPLPLVVALHGAGGSENLFFDGYGDGKAVRLCQQRGWLLVAPRSGLLGGGNLPSVLDELATLYPVDRQRVFVVGHSMGAGQAVAAAQAMPQRFAAVAALGGSGRVSKAEAIRAVPFFIGVGDKDFALKGARLLSERLQAGGVKDVRLKEYPDVEHLVIVQQALPAVFLFFDEIAKR